MAYREIYEKQVALLVRVLPFVADEEEFALKGGTAINLFGRDMPRLSVDIDLTYVPVADRDTSLRAIDNAMKRIADRGSHSKKRSHSPNNRHSRRWRPRFVPTTELKLDRSGTWLNEHRRRVPLMHRWVALHSNRSSRSYAMSWPTAPTAW
ncbi:MAG: nucleotidyl transferase AbiEii/AbiGii toxin family protein [Pseudomonadota bacterium]